MKVLIVGKQGMLAQELQDCLRTTDFEVLYKGTSEMDLREPMRVREFIHQCKPRLIVNAAGYTAVDEAEKHPEIAFAINRDGAQCLAEVGRQLNIPLIHISTDFVFDGKTSRPYREDDPTLPLGVYGQSKWEGEEAVRQCQPEHIIVRTAWLYSVYGRNFLKTMVSKALEGLELRVVNDQWGCPTWVKELASCLVTIMEKIRNGEDIPWGTYHFCGSGETTWFGFAQTIIEQAQKLSTLPLKPPIPIATSDYPVLARRPSYSVLDCSKIHQTFGLRSSQWKESVPECVKELFACPDFPQARF